MKITNIQIITQKSKHKFEVELAKNFLQQAKGLMFKKKLDENKGMLFVFNKERKRSFWMINTTIPLDLIFIDKDSKIVDIIKNTTPLSINLYSSPNPAKYVLEVNSNTADKIGIKVGDSVIHNI
ncbi:DUF192 domain-containing protein [Nanoarchaeota archaeon]